MMSVETVDTVRERERERELHFKEIKGQEGITLIALVITIIVLLILAGVSIATLTGENGILTKADSVGRETEIAEAKEQARLDIAGWTAEQIEKGQSTNISNDIIQNILDGKAYIGSVGSDKFTTKKNGYEILYADLYNSDTIARTPKIPEGFYVVPDLDKVEEGLVISDVPNDIADSGNQFVWIPVTSESEYVRNKTYQDIEVSKNAIDDEIYLPEGITSEKEAVLKAGGFYVGRYEAGKEEGNDKPISKKGATVWNKISQTEAKEKAKAFIKNMDVKSALISGIQWDRVMQFIDGKLDGNGNKYNVKEYSKTRHANSPAASGQNEADRVCNIYDLEGNYWEYIAEKNTYENNNPFCYRSNHFDTLSAAPSSWRDYSDGGAHDNNTFRLVLYV